MTSARKPGVVLMLVLVFLAVLGILMTALSMSMRPVRQAGEAHEESVQLQAAADSAIEEVLAELNATQKTELPRKISFQASQAVVNISFAKQPAAPEQDLVLKIQAQMPAPGAPKKVPPRVLWTRVTFAKSNALWLVSRYEIVDRDR